MKSVNITYWLVLLPSLLSLCNSNFAKDTDPQNNLHDDGSRSNTSSSLDATALRAADSMEFLNRKFSTALTALTECNNITNFDNNDYQHKKCVTDGLRLIVAAMKEIVLHKKCLNTSIPQLTSIDEKISTEIDRINSSTFDTSSLDRTGYYSSSSEQNLIVGRSISHPVVKTEMIDLTTIGNNVAMSTTKPDSTNSSSRSYPLPVEIETDITSTNHSAAAATSIATTKPSYSEEETVFTGDSRVLSSSLNNIISSSPDGILGKLIVTTSEAVFSKPTPADPNSNVVGIITGEEKSRQSTEEDDLRKEGYYPVVERSLENKADTKQTGPSSLDIVKFIEEDSKAVYREDSTHAFESGQQYVAADYTTDTFYLGYDGQYENSSIIDNTSATYNEQRSSSNSSLSNDDTTVKNKEQFSEGTTDDYYTKQSSAKYNVATTIMSDYYEVKNRTDIVEGGSMTKDKESSVDLTATSSPGLHRTTMMMTSESSTSRSISSDVIIEAPVSTQYNVIDSTGLEKTTSKYDRVDPITKNATEAPTTSSPGLHRTTMMMTSESSTNWSNSSDVIIEASVSSTQSNVIDSTGLEKTTSKYDRVDPITKNATEAPTTSSPGLHRTTMMMTSESSTNWSNSSDVIIEASVSSTQSNVIYSTGLETTTSKYERVDPITKNVTEAPTTSSTGLHRTMMMTSESSTNWSNSSDVIIEASVSSTQSNGIDSTGLETTTSKYDRVDPITIMKNATDAPTMSSPGLHHTTTMTSESTSSQSISSDVIIEASSTQSNVIYSTGLETTTSKYDRVDPITKNATEAPTTNKLPPSTPKTEELESSFDCRHPVITGVVTKCRDDDIKTNLESRTRPTAVDEETSSESPSLFSYRRRQSEGTEFFPAKSTTDESLSKENSTKPGIVDETYTTSVENLSPKYDKFVNTPSVRTEFSIASSSSSSTEHINTAVPTSIEKNIVVITSTTTNSSAVEDVNSVATISPSVSNFQKSSSPTDKSPPIILTEPPVGDTVQIASSSSVIVESEADDKLSSSGVGMTYMTTELAKVTREITATNNHAQARSADNDPEIDISSASSSEVIIQSDNTSERSNVVNSHENHTAAPTVISMISDDVANSKAVIELKSTTDSPVKTDSSTTATYQKEKIVDFGDQYVAAGIANSRNSSERNPKYITVSATIYDIIKHEASDNNTKTFDNANIETLIDGSNSIQVVGQETGKIDQSVTTETVDIKPATFAAATTTTDAANISDSSVSRTELTSASGKPNYNITFDTSITEVTTNNKTIQSTKPTTESPADTNSSATIPVFSDNNEMSRLINATVSGKPNYNITFDTSITEVNNKSIPSTTTTESSADTNVTIPVFSDNNEGRLINSSKNGNSTWSQNFTTTYWTTPSTTSSTDGNELTRIENSSNPYDDHRSGFSSEKKPSEGKNVTAATYNEYHTSPTTPEDDECITERYQQQPSISLINNHLLPPQSAYDNNGQSYYWPSSIPSQQSTYEENHLPIFTDSANNWPSILPFLPTVPFLFRHNPAAETPLKTVSNNNHNNQIITRNKPHSSAPPEQVTTANREKLDLNRNDHVMKLLQMILKNNPSTAKKN